MSLITAICFSSLASNRVEEKRSYLLRPGEIPSLDRPLQLGPLTRTVAFSQQILSVCCTQTDDSACSTNVRSTSVVQRPGAIGEWRVRLSRVHAEEVVTSI